MIKTLKRKIQFSNDKDMKRVFLLPSVIKYQELNASKQTKSSSVVRVWSKFLFVGMQGGDGGGGSGDIQYSRTKKQSYIFSLLEEEAKI